jgi:hypothetical protein
MPAGIKRTKEKEFFMQNLAKKMVFFVMAMVVIGSCAAQSANNEAQRFVGTWVPAYP